MKQFLHYCTTILATITGINFMVYYGKCAVCRLHTSHNFMMLCPTSQTTTMVVCMQAA